MFDKGLRRRELVLGLGAALIAPRMAFAQAGPIKLVAPFPPGGSVDAISRLVQPGLQQRLGATVIVENRPGGSGSIGANAVAKAAPDGQSWLMVFDTHAVNPALLPSLPFDTVKDLEPVELLGTAPMVLACHQSRPFKTLADVIAGAKAAPGKLTYATIGNGSLGHLAMVLLGKRAGVQLTHVPYRGGGPAVNDAVGGHVDLIIGSAALLAPQVAGGALRPLVQTAAKRISTMPEVPTVVESGYDGFTADAWWGVFAPAGTPKPIIDKFRAALVETVRDPVITQRLVEQQQVTISLQGGEAFRSFFAEQMRIWGAVVKENGIKPD
ncbi:MAG: Bug family tripartite tricarboxylate transporter substrate binding protein [Bosea sp. (in: a-proteobacteria)]